MDTISSLPDSEPAKINHLLQAGIKAAKAGQPEQARELFLQALEQDGENIQGWLWLSGVMDSQEERRVCLENVLTLDPNNATAQRGLALLGQQPLTKPAQATTPAAPAGSEPPLQTISSRYKRLGPDTPAQKLPSSASGKSRTHPASEGRSKISKAPVELSPPVVTPALTASKKKRETTLDAFPDSYGCPYCARSTRPNDELCAACRNRLWYYLPRQEQTSGLYKFILVLQAFNLVSALLIYSVLMINLSQLEDIPIWAMIGIGLGGGVIILYYAVVLAGFYKRWRVIYYFFLLQALLSVPMIICAGIVNGAEEIITGIFCGGIGFLLAVVQFFLVMNLSEDFAFNKHRILLRIDPTIHSGPNLLSRGSHYSNQKMWALAALYFHKAAGQMPNNIKAHLALAFAYFNLKQFDKAEVALAEARNIDPHSPLVKELEADLQKQQLL